MEYKWEERFQAKYGALRGEVLTTLDAYLDCGILAHGGARAECENPECRHSLVIPFSCKKRICPSCAAKRALIFADHLEQEVLAPVEHRHLVLSIPKRLRPFFRYDRRVNDLLFAAAWQSIQEMFAAVLPRGVPGLVLTLQTSGESLNFNVHLHGMLSAGVFDRACNFHRLENLDQEKLSRLFCHRVLKSLQEKTLIDEAVVAQIVGQQHSGFSAWLGEPVCAGDETYRLFLARYIDRGPVADSRIEIQDDIVTYRTEKDPLTHEFSALEFLARLTPHIANKWESTIRYYGYYSHRARGARKKQQAALARTTAGADQLNILPAQPEQKSKASRTWAALIRRVYETEPLLCERCGSTMRIKAFITDPVEIKRLLNHLSIPGFEKPLPICGPGPPRQVILDPEYPFLQ